MSIRLNITNFYARLMVKPFLRRNKDPYRVRRWLENQAKYFFLKPENFWETPTTFSVDNKTVKGLWVGSGKNKKYKGVPAPPPFSVLKVLILLYKLIL